MPAAWTRLIQSLNQGLTQRLPGTCQVCARWPSLPVCVDCVQRFAPPCQRCKGCAAVLNSPGMLCGACLTAPAARALDSCVAAVDYAFPWDGLVARFKFRSESGWAQPLAEMMLAAPAALPLLSSASLVVPVPLMAERLGSRGYNQAWELVKALSSQASASGKPGPPGLADALVRTRHTPDQHSLPREQRLRNLQGAFAAHPGHAARLAGAHVLLVDDVTTTGATLHSAAQALLQGGAQSVSALVFARTPPH